jgi:hypothetical protein
MFIELIRALVHLVDRLLSWLVMLARGLIIAAEYLMVARPWMIATKLLGLFVIAAVMLVYIVAPIRGFYGHKAGLGSQLEYANERSLATALFDAGGDFLGILHPALDSQRDVHYGGKPVELPNYIAYPDHKTLHVRKVPEHYWQCLKYHEDRYVGSWRNPHGIDITGVLRLPFSAMQSTLRYGRPNFGAGGSTIAMQLARIFFKRPPSIDETMLEKIGRKLKEWWIAPVIQRELTKGGNDSRLKHWASNHFPLAQRAGGDIYGLELTAMIVFGKPSSNLSIAEQYVLAGAVNKPIIILPGSKYLNRKRLRNWQYITEVRARKCATSLLTEPRQQMAVIAELAQLANSPPDPKISPKMEKILTALTSRPKALVKANPVHRSIASLPAVQYGVRAQMKNDFGLDWRASVRGVSLTLDANKNLRFRQKILKTLARQQARFKNHINSNYTLDVGSWRRNKSSSGQLPDIIIAAANARGEIVRYFDSRPLSHYFGSSSARNRANGKYEPARENRAIASVGKILAAIAIASDRRGITETGANSAGKPADTTDTLQSSYLDTAAPDTGLESCRKGGLRRGRKAEVVFACSLNNPLEWRLKKIPDHSKQKLVQDFGMRLPDPEKVGTRPDKSIVVGHVMASPRTVHHMSSVILAALTGRATGHVQQPTLIKNYDLSLLDPAVKNTAPQPVSIIPALLIKPHAFGLLKDLLAAPLCYRYGTLRSIAKWCAKDNPAVRLHFAKTGTRGTGDAHPDADDIVDLWVTGGIRFASQKSYSYVVLIGTGSPDHPWARNLGAGRVLAPLIDALLADLRQE